MNGRELSDKLEISEATVSRLLSGNRNPSFRLMLKIEDQLNWGIAEQSAAIRACNYGDALYQAVVREEEREEKEEKNATTD